MRTQMIFRYIYVLRNWQHQYHTHHPSIHSTNNNKNIKLFDDERARCENIVLADCGVEIIYLFNVICTLQEYYTHDSELSHRVDISMCCCLCRCAACLPAIYSPLYRTCYYICYMSEAATHCVCVSCVHVYIM